MSVGNHDVYVYPLVRISVGIGTVGSRGSYCEVGTVVFISVAVHVVIHPLVYSHVVLVTPVGNDGACCTRWYTVSNGASCIRWGSWGELYPCDFMVRLTFFVIVVVRAVPTGNHGMCYIRWLYPLVSCPNGWKGRLNPVQLINFIIV